MTMKSWVDLVVVTVVILVIGAPLVGAAAPVPASSGTSSLFLFISADARGSLLSGSELGVTQGMMNRSDNPLVEGQATIGYDEKTLGTSGSITYIRTIDLDTSSQGASGANLETVRQIDYTSQGDGNGAGVLYSAESVLIEVDESAAEPGAPSGVCPQPGSEGSCPTCSGDVFGHDPSGRLYIPDCGFSGDEEPCDGGPCDSDQCDEGPCDDAGPTLSSSNGSTPSSVRVRAGSEVQLREGSVNSASSSRTIADDPDAGIAVSYSVNIDGSGQTGNGRAEGNAEVFTDAIVMEGSGAGPAQTTGMSYEQSVMADGLIEISMKTGYSSP